MHALLLEGIQGGTLLLCVHLDPTPNLTQPLSRAARVHAGSSRAPTKVRTLSSSQALVTFDDPNYNIKTGATLSISGVARKSGLNVCLTATVKACPA